MSGRSWTPSTAAVSADSVQQILRDHPIVAVHFWAPWNRAYDEALDSALLPLYKEFGDRIDFRSLDTDDRQLWSFVQGAGVLNLPAIGFWRNGQRDRVVIGLRSLAAWRETFVEVLRSPASTTGGEESTGRANGNR